MNTVTVTTILCRPMRNQTTKAAISWGFPTVCALLGSKDRAGERQRGEAGRQYARNTPVDSESPTALKWMGQLAPWLSPVQHRDEALLVATRDSIRRADRFSPPPSFWSQFQLGALFDNDNWARMPSRALAFDSQRGQASVKGRTLAAAESLAVYTATCLVFGL